MSSVIYYSLPKNSLMKYLNIKIYGYKKILFNENAWYQTC